MYKFFLRKHIYRSLETKEFGCSAKIEVELPFIPFVGLHINAGGCSNEVTFLEWSTESKSFYCLVDDTGPEKYDCSYEFVKNILEDDGWQLSGDTKAGLFPNE